MAVLDSKYTMTRVEHQNGIELIFTRPT